MTKAEQTATIEALKDKLSGIDFFYLADSSTLTVEQVNKLRRLCFDKGIEMKVVKNTLIQKALESSPGERDYSGLYEALKGPTAILISEKANAPAKLIKAFRETHEKPTLKAAYIDTDVFLGDDKLDELSKLKSILAFPPGSTTPVDDFRKGTVHCPFESRPIQVRAHAFGNF